MPPDGPDLSARLAEVAAEVEREAALRWPDRPLALVLDCLLALGALVAVAVWRPPLALGADGLTLAGRTFPLEGVALVAVLAVLVRGLASPGSFLLGHAAVTVLPGAPCTRAGFDRVLLSALFHHVPLLVAAWLAWMVRLTRGRAVWLALPRPLEYEWSEWLLALALLYQALLVLSVPLSPLLRLRSPLCRYTTFAESLAGLGYQRFAYDRVAELIAYGPEGPPDEPPGPDDE